MIDVTKHTSEKIQKKQMDVTRHHNFSLIDVREFKYVFW